MSFTKTSNWHAWINMQPIQPTKGGTLHVTGEIVDHPTQVATIVKKVPQGINPRILLLEIIIHTSGVPIKQPQTMNYPESLAEGQKYDSIEVFLNSKIETNITKIPIIV
jgi:hypothetical protein